jgi:hypothetical protein
MPEISGTLNSIKDWEDICQNLVSLGMAEFIKERQGDSKAYVKVYNVFVGSGLNLKRVCWRFYFDERPGTKSSLRISEMGFDVLLKSMTVMNALRKLNMKLANGDKYDLDKLRKVMEEALIIVENKEKEVIKNGIIAEAEKAPS